MKIKKCGKVKGSKKIKLYNCDNKLLMEQLPDNYFDLGLFDPPYGISTTKQSMDGREINKRDKDKSWDAEPPSDEYFKEIHRVCRDYIVFGGNYFHQLWPSKGFIIWDKKIRGLDFADCELATSTINDGARIYDRSANDKKRIHVNQKPVKIYAWLLERYAEKGFKVFDSHLGSGSSAIAAHFFGCDFIGCERDVDYYKRLVKRFKKETAQNTLFEGFGV